MPEAWRRGHVRLAVALTGLCLAGGALAGPAELGVQLAVAAIGVALLGLPHGAVDHLFGRLLLAPRLGRAWPPVFAGGYLALGAAVIAVWLVAPVLGLGLFLALSVWHFGSEDVALAPLLPPRRAGPETVARGLLPVLLPIAFRPAETGLLFGWLLLAEAPAAVGEALAALAPLTLPAALALVAALLAAALVRRASALALEVCLLAGSFAVLPPLLAFTLYFGLWHAPRHSLRVIADQAAMAGVPAGEPQDLGPGVRAFARAAAGLTLATLALAGTAWWALGGPAAVDRTSVQVIFIGLAALTVPHAALHAAIPRLPAAALGRAGEGG
ncbi:MAG: beta-carotene 15,15'-dioxygenase, Brp/Blh family [Alphaproteobacteria bacterium]|nr:beta-carotene 15,15'-dioxygenase, Brp/Blh family [Alphaproteobacteria bacterium]